ncbi:MAG TPA: response regulator [Polyangia bacterium]|nr:response regulator [Polyangia bacterium]
MLRHDDSDQPVLPGASRARILVVEDNAPNRQLLHDILQLRGHDVLEAANVDEATRALASVPVDLLLLDVNIPGGGAEAVIREARRTLRLGALPIVAVTSMAMPGDRERLLGSGFQGYLSKPIDTRTFAATVEQFLRAPAGTAADPHVPAAD